MARPVASLVLSLSLAACGHDAAVAVDGSPSLDASVRPAGVALCYTATADAHPATVAFRAALAMGARDLRAQRIADLDAATTALPDEEEVHLLLGLAYLWRLAEPLPGEDALAVQAADATAARDQLERAYALCPTDHRIAAWLGPILVRFGRALGDQPTIDEGLAVLDRGIAAYPSFVLFSKLLIYADDPRDSSGFQGALAAVVADLDACQVTPTDPACSNATVPHNREGGGVFLGDALAKAGRRAEAEAAYTDAAAGADFATWTYQPELTSRLTNLDVNLALFANADPADDPAVAWRSPAQCALCHTR